MRPMRSLGGVARSHVKAKTARWARPTETAMTEMPLRRVQGDRRRYVLDGVGGFRVSGIVAASNGRRRREDMALQTSWAAR